MADIANPLQIFICRHGETEWTQSGQHTSFTDIPLAEKGKVQAVLLGKRLRSIPFNKILLSPMKRTIETCELAGLHHPTIIEPNAMEWNYGSYEGLTRQQILEKNPKWNLFTMGAPNGESPAEVADRADTLLKMVRKETGNVVIFTHGHFSRVLAARWIGLDAEMSKSFVTFVASISILSYERSERVIQLWNDTEHLNDGLF